MEKNVNDLIVTMAVLAWKSNNERLSKFVGKLTDEQLVRDIAPGKNSGSYLLGHLTAVHDNMLPLLDFSEKLFPQLDKIFVTSPDKAHPQPPVSDLRKMWKDVTDKLNSRIDATSTTNWFLRHTAVSEDDFEKEPHRNKLNVLLNRTTHLSYHFGQLILLDGARDNQ